MKTALMMMVSVCVASHALAQTSPYVIASDRCYSTPGGADGYEYACRVSLIGSNGSTVDLGDGMMPVLSPDASRVAYMASPYIGGGAFVMNLSDRTIAGFPATLSNVAWAPDSTEMAFRNPADGQLYAVSADGLRIRPLTRNVNVHPDRISWSPDGRTLAFTCEAQPGNLDICTVDKAGTTVARLTGDPASDSNADFSSAGLVAFATTRYGPQSEIATVAPGGAVARLGNGIGGSWPVWSPNSAQIAYVAGQNTIMAMNANGTAAHVVGSGYGIAWSPDSLLIATAQPWYGACEADGRICGYGNVFVFSASGSGAVWGFEGLNPDWVRVAGPATTLFDSPSPTPPSIPNTVPIQVPGTVEAEQFDDGGPNVAYFDNTVGNSGGQYRDGDVDIEATSDGGGFNVGWMTAGEWLKYTVNVSTAGSFLMVARVASNGLGGSFHVEIDGNDSTGIINIPNTGGWQQWTHLARSVALSAGVHVVRVALDANGPGGSVGNLDYLRFTTSDGTSHPYGGVAATVPGTIEAERFDDGGRDVAYSDSSPGNSGGQYRETDVDIEATTDGGGGFNVGWMAAGEWLTYTVNVSTGGTFALVARVACNGPGGTFHVEVDRADATGPLMIPDTFGWQAWTDITRNVVLPGGTHTLRVVVDAAGAAGRVGNLNFLRLTASTGSRPFGGVAATIPGTIEAERFDDGDAGVAYVDVTAGNSGGQLRDGDVDIELTTDAGGGYNVGWMQAGEWLAYSVSVSAAGSYSLAARVASNGAGGRFHIEVDGTPVSGPFVIPDTGGWQRWTDVQQVVTLPSGMHLLRIVLDENGPGGNVGNINYLRFAPTTATAWLWGFIVNINGVCIEGATVQVISGQAVGQVVVQETPCDAWGYGGGFLFTNLVPNVAMTLRATASGYAPLEQTFVPFSGAGSAVLMVLTP